MAAMVVRPGEAAALAVEAQLVQGWAAVATAEVAGCSEAMAAVGGVGATVAAARRRCR